MLITLSCESEQSRKERLEKENQLRIEKENLAEAERHKKEIYERYISNSLQTGATPYSLYFGKNSHCDNYDCSKIKIKTSNSDVVVIIKKNDKVVGHAYIQARDSYTFTVPNGTYQVFFYSGRGWYPEKEIKGGEIKGGFIENEVFEKDTQQFLSNIILTYELIMQVDGNFRTLQSTPEEVF